MLKDWQWSGVLKKSGAISAPPADRQSAFALTASRARRRNGPPSGFISSSCGEEGGCPACALSRMVRVAGRLRQRRATETRAADLCRRR